MSVCSRTYRASSPGTKRLSAFKHETTRPSDDGQSPLLHIAVAACLASLSSFLRSRRVAGSYKARNSSTVWSMLFKKADRAEWFAFPSRMIASSSSARMTAPRASRHNESIPINSPLASQLSLIFQTDTLPLPGHHGGQKLEPTGNQTLARHSIHTR